jgi:hypothetical protein
MYSHTLHIFHIQNRPKQVTFLILASIMAGAIMMWYIKKWERGWRDTRAHVWCNNFLMTVYQVKFFGVRILKKKGICEWIQKDLFILGRHVSCRSFKGKDFLFLGCWMWTQKNLCKLATSERLGQLSIIFCVYVCEKDAVEIRSWGQSEEKWGSLTLTFPSRYLSLFYSPSPDTARMMERDMEGKKKEKGMNELGSSRP